MITEHKFWFNTGVRQENCGVDMTLFNEHYAWRGGTMQIAYYLEYAPPKGSVCKYLCNYPELAERDGLLAIPVVGGGMVSKFAFFTK